MSSLHLFVQMLFKNPFDEDTREAVEDLIRGSVDGLDNDVGGGKGGADILIERLRSELQKVFGGNADADANAVANAVAAPKKKEEDTYDKDGSIARLTKVIMLKQQDVQTFASGLVADHIEINPDTGKPTIKHFYATIANFYAKMIDPTDNHERP